ncbi:MAG: Microtubule-associated protein, microtubule dynamics during spindle orientation [Trizodia sp. TS-e1964]|nr:MAG: Microtubule-associated protein, microtubule dynamics during spindle orientation [Trizodia sp. TS-e1964]
MAEPEEDFSTLPLSDRFAHKLWKVRKQAYEEAATAFQTTPDESHPAFAPFTQDPNLWKAAVTDSNVAAQQEGITALCSFLQYGGTLGCTRTRGLTVSPLVEKGLSSTRAVTKAKALEALMLYIEIDKVDPVIEELIPHLSHKQPKIIAATLSALTQIYHAYGVKIVDPKPVLKALPKVFGHADKNVRAEAQNLAVELYRWLREAIKPIFWGDLKPVQQQDLEVLFEKAKQEPAPKQERLLRSQQAARAAASGNAQDENGGEEEEEEEIAEPEAVDLADPVDVMPKIPKELSESLASTKWKERKETLDELFAVLNTPKIKEGSFDEIVRCLAKCMKDANIAVLTVAANCVEVLARGLRKSFTKYKSLIMGPLFERLKEKKQTVADALGQALDAVFASTSLSECLEENLEFLKHKNPQIKQESLRFLIRCLQNTRVAPDKTEVKSIADAATKLLTESSEVTRSGGAEVLGTLMKIMGERPMSVYLEGLDDIRKAKIKEYFDTAKVKAKDRPKPIVAPPALKAAPPPAKKILGPRPAGALKKRPVGAPAAASALPAPAAEVAPSAPPQSKLGRSNPSKLGAPPKSGLATPGAGLKLPKKLAEPKGFGTPTPKRSSSAQAPPENFSPPPQPKFGAGGRGLAGRPLGKPLSNVPVEPAPPVAAAGLTALQRAELEEFKAEKERLQRTNEDLRTERTKLHSQINELQNQNAQLIEDHTRDMLSIKAKETQLVRARSDAEAAEQMCQKQQREIERLKRELSRAVRATSPAPADVSEQIYRDAGLNGSISAASGYGGYSGRGKRMSIASTLSEEKENGSLDPNSYRGTKMSPPLSSGMSSGTGGRGSPTVVGREPSESGTTGTGEGIESWKRAAEVTSQLKARIEQMKARQGLSRK